MRNIIISANFHPIEGGIQTYMYQIAQNWELGDSLIICSIEKDEPSCTKKPFTILRSKKKVVTYPRSVLQMLKHVSKAKISLNSMKYCALLLINRAIITRINDRVSCLLDSLKNNGSSIIQVSTPLPNGAIGLLGKLIYNIPLITYIHGTEINKYSQKLSTRMLLKFVLRNSDLVIANSNYTKNLVNRFNLEQNKVKVVNLGANLKDFYPLTINRDFLNNKRVLKNSKILLTISHLVDRKGHDAVIEALSELVQKHPQLIYLIVGRGPSKDRLEALVKAKKLNNHVIFVGFVENSKLNSYMNCCDIFIMPNREEDGDVEGYGIAFVEANACKKPVIGGKSGGAVDAVLDGKTGLLVDPYSIAEVRAAINKLVTNESLCQELGEYGYLRAKNELNWQCITNKINKFIKEEVIERSNI